MSADLPAAAAAEPAIQAPVQDESIVGFAAGHIVHPVEEDNPAAQLIALVIAPRHERTGAGTALVHEFETWACSNGARRALVNSGEQRRETIFYEHRGTTVWHRAPLPATVTYGRNGIVGPPPPRRPWCEQEPRSARGNSSNDPTTNQPRRKSPEEAYPHLLTITRADVPVG